MQFYLSQNIGMIKILKNMAIVNSKALLLNLTNFQIDTSKALLIFGSDKNSFRGLISNVKFLYSNYY